MDATEPTKASRARIITVIAVAAAMFAGIGVAFWYEDLRYSRPTPRPPSLTQPPIGSALALDAWLAEAKVDARDRPVLVHFFNPDCPCSKFNVAHVRELRSRFGDRVAFVGAVQTYEDGNLDAEKRSKIAQAVAKLDIGIDWFVDVDGKLAALAGVYSTPQAVLVDPSRHIVFRGNYNVSRYCTDPKTEFARIAIEDFLARNPEKPSASPLVERPAYGCELPSNVQASK